MIDGFKQYLVSEGKSSNTISSYLRHLEGYAKWYRDSYGSDLNILYRANILDYISYLKNIKKDNAKTINAKLSALCKLNEYLMNTSVQESIVITSKDFIKVQGQFASPCTASKKDVEAFRQRILEQESKRDYAIVTIMAYAGLRVSEVLDLRSNDVDLVSREIVVRGGKGDKQRIVYANDKIVNSIKEYLKERDSESEYLFVSRQSERINRTRINQIFNKHSKVITPHVLRHFFCTNAIEAGYSIHEVANQAGHSNIHTTLLYTNPSKEKMKEKANLL